MNPWPLVGVIVLANACADLLDTAGMRHYGKVEDLHPKAVVRLVRTLIRNRFVLGGIAANAVGFFTLVSLLSIANVSFAVPASASSVVVETALAKLILKEDVHWQRWLGAIQSSPAESPCWRCRSARLPGTLAAHGRRDADRYPDPEKQATNQS